MNSELCVIIPCYNEEKRLNINVFSNQKHIDFIFVNDGSTDNTKNILENLTKTSNHLNVLHLKKNKGKAEAIRMAALECLNNNYNYIAYLDADLSTSVEELLKCFEALKSNEKSLTMASRVKLINTSINRKFKRHFFGRILATIVDDFILKLGIYDTQCGAKVMTRNIAKTVFKEPFKTTWLFDIEIIARIKEKYGYEYCKKNIMEIPLQQWEDVKGSKISFSDFLTVPFSIAKIYYYYPRKK